MTDSAARALLMRQLKKHGLLDSELPTDLGSWQGFLERIKRTYVEHDESRLSSENVLDVSLQEMERLQAELSLSNQKRIREMNEHLTLVLQASDLGTWDWDLKTGAVRFDERWCSIIGLKKEDVPETFESFSSRVHPEDLPEVMEAANGYLAGKLPRFEVHFRMLHVDGHWVDILAKGKVMGFGLDGTPLRFMGTHFDESADKNIHRQLELQRVKLIHSSKLASLGEMSAGIAHEINNPLAVLEATLDFLPRVVGNPEKFSEKIAFMKKACHRMGRIIGGLKKFSRNTGDLSLSYHFVSELLKDALVLVDSKAKKHGVPISVDCDPAFKILCDEIEIVQVLVNLIGNAVDAVKISTEKWVKVQVSSSGESIVIRVVDSGPGILEAIEHKIFEPFFTTKKVGEGTGLGLSITKGILEDHHATIKIARDIPNTCFEICFRMKKVPGSEMSPA